MTEVLYPLNREPEDLGIRRTGSYRKKLDDNLSGSNNLWGC